MHFEREISPWAGRGIFQREGDEQTLIPYYLRDLVQVAAFELDLFAEILLTLASPPLISLAIRHHAAIERYRRSS